MSVNVEGNAIVKVDGQQAGQQIEKLEQKAKELRAEMVKLKKQKIYDGHSYNKLNKDLKGVKDEIKAVEKYTIDYKNALNNLSGKSIKDLNILHRNLNKEVKKYGRNTLEYKKAVGHLQKVKAEMANVRAEMNAAIPKTNRFGLSLKTIGANLLGGLGITAGVGMLVGALNSFIQKAKVVNDMNQKVKNTFDLSGRAARNLTSDIIALSDTYQVDSAQMLQSANAVSKEMGISAKEALTFIEEGFKKGSNNTGEFLDILKEYPAQFKAASIDAETMFAIINQQVKEGIYSDKGVDAIKEGGLLLRKNTKATQDALAPLNESVKLQIKQEIAAGNSFAAIQLVSEALKDTSLTASESQAIIADVFGGAGEDAGLRYLQMLSDIDTNLENVANQSSVYKDATLELSKQYNKFTLSATEGNGFISESLAGVLDHVTDVLVALTRFNDGTWSDRLKIILNATLFTFKKAFLPIIETIEKLTGIDLSFKVDDNTATKALGKIVAANAKVIQSAEELANAQKENILLSKEEITAQEKKQEAARKAYKKAVAERNKLAKLEQKALQEIYDFIAEKEQELKDINPFDRKLEEIDLYYDKLIHKAVDANASKEEIDLLNKLRDEEINLLKIEEEERTQLAIFELKKQYGLLTDEEILNAEIEKVKRLGEEKILNEKEVLDAISNIRKKHSENEKKQEKEQKTRIQKNQEIELEFIKNVSDAYASALEQGNLTAKEAMKIFLINSLDMLKRQVQLMIAAATAREIGTKGFVGIGTAAVLTGLINVAFGIAKGAINGFSEGGYTGPGQTQEVAGVVHKDEYVIPSNMLANSNVAKVVSSLETARTGGSLNYSAINKAMGKGFSEGGYTSTPNNTPNNANINTDDKYLTILQEVRDYRNELAEWQKNHKTYVVYEDIEEAAEELNASRAAVTLGSD